MPGYFQDHNIYDNISYTSYIIYLFLFYYLCKLIKYL